jgi:hypothetical protein
MQTQPRRFDFEAARRTTDLASGLIRGEFGMSFQLRSAPASPTQARGSPEPAQDQECVKVQELSCTKLTASFTGATITGKLYRFRGGMVEKVD